jgi:hypothetical protein
MATDRTTYTNGNGRHAYEVYAYEDKQCRVTKNFKEKIFEVHASNRNQAARRVERDGYEVSSVNMIG